jgi:hypothetical protein
LQERAGPRARCLQRTGATGAKEQAVDAHDLDDRPGDPVVLEGWLGAPARSYARRPATVLDVLDRAVRRWPERTAFVDVDGTAVSYAEFAARVETGLRPCAPAGCRPARRSPWRPATRWTSRPRSSPAPGRRWSWSG